MNFAEVLLSDETARSMNMYLLSFLSLTTMPGLLAFISLSASTGIIQSQLLFLAVFHATHAHLPRFHKDNVINGLLKFSADDDDDDDD